MRNALRALVVFALGASAAIAVGIAAAAFVGGALGVSQSTLTMAVASGSIAAGLLVLSAWLLRREGMPLDALGLPTNRHRARELGLGFVVSAVLFLAVTWTQSVVVNAQWQFQGTRGVMAALAGLVMTACMVSAEELLFRGVGLRYLRKLCGDWGATMLTAMLFGAYHLVGSQDWAMGAFFRFLTSALGGVLFAWSAVRSGGLALPIGLHFGGNWVQASIAGFTTPGGESVPALWRIPISPGDMQLLVAPDVLPRLPYFVAIGTAATVTWMFLRTRRTTAR